MAKHGRPDSVPKWSKRVQNVEDLKSGLFKLDYGGGGDIPEQAFKGTNFVLQRGSQWDFQK